MSDRNKHLEEHIKDTPKAGRHDDERIRQRETEALQELARHYNSAKEAKYFEEVKNDGN